MIKGFDHDDCLPPTADRVAPRFAWMGRRMDELKGQVVRLEFLMEEAVDLYSFRAIGEKPDGSNP